MILTAVAQSHRSFKYPKINNSDAFLLETIKSVTPLFPSKTGNFGAILLCTSRVPVVRNGSDNDAVGRRATCEYPASRVRYIRNLQLQETKIRISHAFLKQL